ncbi:MAG: SDR family NAD(P)-dependent oxidoreductase [Phycisphaerae bacterium]
MKNPFSLQGHVALITGGGSGLGYGMAEAFTAAGGRVVLLGRRKEVLAEAAGTLGEAAGFRVFDVTADDAAAMVGEVEQSVGPVTCLINNAGVHLKKPASETTDAEFEAVLRTHLTGGLALVRAVAPRMVDRKAGSIIFIASMTTFIGMPRVIAYAAAKSGVGGMVRTLAAELSEHGVRVNAIAPGWIESPMLHKALAGDEARKNKILARTPMGRFGDPADIGHAAVYLAADASRFVTGVVLPIDGGASIGF